MGLELMSSEDQNAIRENKISEIRKKKNANGRDDNDNGSGARFLHRRRCKKLPQGDSFSIWERLLEPGVLLEAAERRQPQKNHTNKIPASAARETSWDLQRPPSWRPESQPPVEPAGNLKKVQV